MRWVQVRALLKLSIAGRGLAVASSALNGALASRRMAASREHRSIVLEADVEAHFDPITEVPPPATSP